MRFIDKTGIICPTLDVENATPPTTPAQAKQRWKDFRPKSAVGKFLWRQQFGICAYTELALAVDISDSHIEHIKPKSTFPNDTFSFCNLVLSALKDTDLAALSKDEYYGGHAKLNHFDEELFVSCLDPTCSSYFFYNTRGEVTPKQDLSNVDKQKADYTIALLNLNSSPLVVLRKNWIKSLSEFVDKNCNDTDSLYNLAALELLPAENGTLTKFFSITSQYLNLSAADVRDWQQ